MVCVVKEADAVNAIRVLSDGDETVREIGRLVERTSPDSEQCVIRNCDEAWLVRDR